MAGDKWHLEEVVITIGWTKQWLWRAVDQNGVELDILIRSRRNKAAAKRLLRKLIRKQMRTPDVMITDKLGSYGAAKCEVMPGAEHRQHKGLNNWAENSHQPRFCLKGCGCRALQRQQAGMQKFWAGPTIHGSFESFQTIDLPFRLAIAPMLSDCVSHGVDVPA
jgi:transposase-like protein